MNQEHYQIQSGIPIPECSRGVRGVYPFGKMNVGDSFSAPKSKKNSIQSLVSVRNRIGGKKFATRSIGNEVRVWRVG